MVPGILTRIFNFRNYLVLAIICIAVLTFFAKQYAFFSFDLYITKQIQQINLIFFSDLMLFITWLGNFYPTIFSVSLAFGFFWFYKRKELAWGVLISSVGAVLISETLKILVGRPRPDANIINQIETFFKNDSFPSGHVLYFMGFYGFLLLAANAFIKNKVWRRIVSVILLVLIILVGLSRIYIGSHWFSDTLASYLIGSVWLYIMVLLFKKYELQLKKNGK